MGVRPMIILIGEFICRLRTVRGSIAIMKRTRGLFRGDRALLIDSLL